MSSKLRRRLSNNSMPNGRPTNTKPNSSTEARPIFLTSGHTASRGSAARSRIRMVVELICCETLVSLKREVMRSKMSRCASTLRDSTRYSIARLSRRRDSCLAASSSASRLASCSVKRACSTEYSWLPWPIAIHSASVTACCPAEFSTINGWRSK